MGSQRPNAWSIVSYARVCDIWFLDTSKDFAIFAPYQNRRSQWTSMTNGQGSRFIFILLLGIDNRCAQVMDGRPPDLPEILHPRSRICQVSTRLARTSRKSINTGREARGSARLIACSINKPRDTYASPKVDEKSRDRDLSWLAEVLGPNRGPSLPETIRLSSAKLEPHPGNVGFQIRLGLTIRILPGRPAKKLVFGCYKTANSGKQRQSDWLVTAGLHSESDRPTDPANQVSVSL